MKFEKRQRFEASLEEVERALLDERYLAFLLEHHPTLDELELLDRVEEGSKVRRRVRYLPKPVISSIGPKPIPPNWFGFVESSTYDRESHTMTFENVPTSNRISGMLVNAGLLKLEAAGSGCERLATGDLKIKVPFLLKPLAPIAERLIHAEGMKILDNEAPVLDRFVKEGLRS